MYSFLKAFLVLMKFHFCCPFAKRTRKEMFEKVDSFTEEHQLSRTHCVSVCDNGVSGMTRMKGLCIHEKLKQKF